MRALRLLLRALRLLLLALCVVPLAAPAQQWHTLTFRQDAPGIDANPLRGFVPYSGERHDSEMLPHSLEWFYLPLSDVVTGPDTYDWGPLENHLEAIAGRGHQAVFRFFVDYPGKPSGIPKYLLDAGLKTLPYTDHDNAKGATPSVAPDYRDHRLIDCLVRFVRAFGARYDGDPRIAYLTAGLYGFWGEWHVYPHPRPGDARGWTIAQKDKDAILKAYASSFHRTQVEVRYGNVSTDRKLLGHFGFHDDSFLRDTLVDKDWGFWTAVQAAHAGESWKLHATGGEVYPQLEQGLWDAWPNTVGEDVAQAIATTHATWMLEAEMFSHPPTPEQRENAVRAIRLLGYTFFCSAFRVEGRRVTLRVENRGVAPMYYAWPAEAQALNAEGSVVGKGNAVWAIPALLPGQTAEWSITLDTLPDDAAKVLVRIANPVASGHPVAFANQEMGTTLEQWLTLELASKP